MAIFKDKLSKGKTPGGSSGSARQGNKFGVGDNYGTGTKAPVGKERVSTGNIVPGKAKVSRLK